MGKAKCNGCTKPNEEHRPQDCVPCALKHGHYGPCKPPVKPGTPPTGPAGPTSRKWVMKDCEIKVGGGGGDFWVDSLEPIQGVQDVVVELEGTFDPKILEELGVAKCAKINEANGKQCELYNCEPGDMTWHRTGSVTWRNKPVAGYRFEGPSVSNTVDLEPVSETVEVEVDVRKRVDELALDIGYSALRKWLG